MMKRTGIWAALALSTALAMPAFAEEPSVDTVVATVNGTTLTLGHLIALRDTLPQQYQSLPDDVLLKGLMDQLVQQTALEQTAGELSKHDALIIENERRGFIAGLVIQKVIDTAVTDEALQAAYDAKYKNAEPATEYNAAHILVDSEEKAKDLKDKLESGADFAELAKENSTDTGSGANGGDLGWFGLGMMVKPFEDAVVSAEKGAIVGPIKTDFGYHLITVKETRAAEAPSLDQVRTELASEIERAAIDKAVKDITDKAEITRPGDQLDPALLRNDALFDK